ncbi:carboxypeptidase-like regulatory domain-containing protein [Vibrio cholerae]|nr:carboxypeptidase regulatory-like domain-containing protein [Vibrio cholerae]
MIQVKGTLTDAGGNPASHAHILFKTSKGFGSVLPSAELTVITDSQGGYDFTLSVGIHLIYVRYGDGFELIGKTVINSDTPSPLTVSDLLNQTQPLLPEEIAQVATMLAEVKEKSEQVANHAIFAELYASQSKASADRAAAVVTGGTATFEPSPGKIPLADARGKISSGWLDWDSSAMAIALASGGRLEVIKDAVGNAHLFGVWPIQTYEQLQIPNCPFTGVIDVFRKQDGTFRSECRIAIHKSVNVGGRTVSRAGLAPYVNLNFDEFKTKASDLSGGFRMLDVYHDAFINWQILSILAKGGQQPRGNTEWGRAHDMISEVGRRVDGMLSNERTGNGATLTGSGPNSWRHDGTAFGVSDWVGNVWEWIDGLKMVNGQFYLAQYSGQPEAQWVATGRYINSGNVLSMTPPTSPVSGEQTWGLLTKTGNYVGNELMQKLFIEPIDCTKILNGRFYYNTDGERLPLRRGSWSNAGNAGPAALYMLSARSLRDSRFAGRLAFVS